MVGLCQRFKGLGFGSPYPFAGFVGDIPAHLIDEKLLVRLIPCLSPHVRGGERFLLVPLTRLRERSWLIEVGY